MTASHSSHDDAIIESMLIIGCVGATAGGEFLAWRNALGLPDPEAVLLDPDSFVLPERSDRAFAALNAVTSAVIANCTPERWEAGWRALIAAMKADQPDLAVVSARALLKHRPPSAHPPRDVLVAMAPVLREAGLFDSLAPQPAQ